MILSELKGDLEKRKPGIQLCRCFDLVVIRAATF